MAGIPVKVYALSTCSHCRNAKKLLNDHGVAYDCVDVDQTQGAEREKVLDEVRRYNPNCSFPTILIGDKVIVGYRENEIKEALGL